MTDREKFEAWFRSNHDNQLIKKGDGYSDPVNQLMWQAWQAALASQQPADDGWIEWAGGECPVKFSAMVDVKHRSEEWSNSRLIAAVADWSHKTWCADTDIIAYRVVKP